MTDHTDGQIILVLQGEKPLSTATLAALKAEGYCMVPTDSGSTRSANRDSRVLDALFQAIGESVALFDAHGIVMAVNETFAARLGRSVEQCIGHDVYTLIPQDVASRRREFVRQVIESRQSTSFVDEREGRWIDQTLYPVTAPDGTVDRVIIYATDITAHRRMKRDLAQERELLQTIIDTIPVMITRYNPDTRVMYLNREFEKKVGWTSEEARTVDLMEQVYPDPEYRRVAAEYMMAATNEWREFLLHTRDGQKLPSQWSNIRLPDGTQVGIGLDMTERNRAIQEQQLLLRETHHRIKNNFTVVQSLLNLQAHGDIPPEAAIVLRDAESRVSGMRTLYETLLHADQYAQVSMREYLQELCSTLMQIYDPEGRLHLKTELADAALATDSTFVAGAIVVELVTNSLKYAFPHSTGGTINVQFAAHDSAHVIKVSDDGAGLPPSVDPQSTGSFGFTLVRMMAQQLGGAVTVDQVTGGGTRITVTWNEASATGT